MSEYRFSNALARETSPYLLQHAHNPVAWYPWGEEALRRAREEEKPILLSIGYSACHWCHVMERESFENESTARIMNEHFINIKVDREERPDLDAIYMSAVQVMTGHGGWPMTVFLTPNQVPFYGGTYFPPEDRHGLPGFPRLLKGIAAAYQKDKEAIGKDAGKILQELRKIDAFFREEGELESDLLDAAAQSLIRGIDYEFGGFGTAPKFPNAMALDFLLRSHFRTGEKRYLEAVDLALDKMACGGIYDHIGGGFHRYSVDRYWLVPHFEKMLYDNALLSRLYLCAWLLTRKPLYRLIATETLDYIVREMTSADGGFYSTQDADSDGHEGLFFLWTPEEVRSLLGEPDADIFCRYFDITSEGNFEHKNILNIPRPANLVARLNGIEESRLAAVIERGKPLLLEARRKRTSPARDDKVLTAWNGLMLRSFAEASIALKREDYREIAAQNARFILTHLESEGQLLRSHKDGESRYNAYLEDYACLIDGLISLYEATGDPYWIRESIRLADVMTDRFWDAGDGGFYFTAREHEALILRPKDFYDNATPSGNSVAAFALLRLWKLTTDERWLQYPDSILRKMAVPMSHHPSAFSNLLCSADFLLSRSMEIALVGDPADPRTQAMLREIHGRYLPNKVVAYGLEDFPELLGRCPRQNMQPAAYVCENFTCGLPATSPEELEARILGRREI